MRRSWWGSPPPLFSPVCAWFLLHHFPVLIFFPFSFADRSRVLVSLPFIFFHSQAITSRKTFAHPFQRCPFWKLTSTAGRHDGPPDSLITRHG